MRLTCRAALLAGLMAIAPVSTLHAQDSSATTAPAAPTTMRRPGRAFGLASGITVFDLAGTGTAPLTLLHFEVDATRWLLVDGAIGVFRPREQTLEQYTYFVREVQAQFQIPAQVWRPYLGVGAGSVVGDFPDVERFTASIATGVRAWIPQTHVDLRGELRVRGIGTQFGAYSVEWTFGVAYRF
jgi:hypothetical protein